MIPTCHAHSPSEDIDSKRSSVDQVRDEDPPLPAIAGDHLYPPALPSGLPSVLGEVDVIARPVHSKASGVHKVIRDNLRSKVRGQRVDMSVGGGHSQFPHWMDRWGCPS